MVMELFSPGSWNIIDIMIVIVTYQWFLLGGILGAAYFGFIKLFTMPLLTRNPHELVLILSPGKTKIFKVSDRLLPFFSTKRATYWYSEPLKIHVKIAPRPVKGQKKIKPKKKAKFSLFKREKELKKADCLGCGNKFFGSFCSGCGTPAVAASEPITEPSKTEPAESKDVTQDIDTGSLLHVYVDAVNQPIYALERNDNKVMDLTVHRASRPETKAHNVYIPPRFSFGRNWLIVINGETAYIEKTNKKQPHKIGFFTRIGVYMVKEKELEEGNHNSGSTTTLESVTVQKILEEVGGVVQNSNFSAGFARKLAKDIKNYERSWVMTLLGMFDMRIILVIIIMFGLIAMVFLLYKPGDMSGLGPMPGS